MKFKYSVLRNKKEMQSKAYLLLITICALTYTSGMAFGQDNKAHSEFVDAGALFDNLDCGGELIQLEGQLHITSRVQQTADGTKEVLEINLVNAKGVGVDSDGVETGKTYKITLSQTSKLISDLDLGSTTTGQGTFHFNVIGSDQKGDVLVHFTFQQKISADGELTLDNFKTDTKCTT